MGYPTFNFGRMCGPKFQNLCFYVPGSLQIGTHLTLSLPMSPLCYQRQSANVAIMRLGHVACFSDV